MAQVNRFFDASALRLLAEPERWALVSSHAPPDVPALKRPPARRLQWTRRHAHCHANPEFLLALRAHGHFGYRDSLYRIRPGTVFFLDSFETHDLGYPRSAVPADHLWISLLQDRVFAFVLNLRGAGWAAAARERCMLSAQAICLDPLGYLRDLANGRDLPSEWRRERLLSAARAVVVKIVEEGFECPGGHRDEGEFQAHVIDAVMRQIRETAGRGVSLDSLARIAGYSKFHFHRLFKHHTGQTVLGFINHCRCERVREMIEEGHSHKQIGAALGFSCPAAFSRWHRQQSLG